VEKAPTERDDWYDKYDAMEDTAATETPVAEEATSAVEISERDDRYDKYDAMDDTAATETPVQTETSAVEISERDDRYDKYDAMDDTAATETPVPRERPSVEAQQEAVAEDIAETPVIAAGTVPETPVVEKTGYESLNHPDTGITDDVETYWKLRAGKEGERRIKEGETRAEYLDRFLTDQFRPIVGGRLHTPFIEADWLSGAPEEARHAFGRVLSRIETEAPEIYEMQTEDAAQAAYDYIYFSATDPTSIGVALGAAFMTGGVGVPAAIAAARAGGMAALRKVLVHKAGGLVTSALLGGAQSGSQEYALQRVEREAHVNPQTRLYEADSNYDDLESDYGRIALATAAGVVLEGAGGAFGVWRSVKMQKNKKIQLEKYMKQRTMSKKVADTIDTLDTDILNGKTTPEAHALAAQMTKDSAALFNPKKGTSPSETGLFSVADGVTEEGKTDALRSILNVEVEKKLTESTTEILKEFKSRNMLDSLSYTKETKDGGTSVISISDALEQYRNKEIAVSTVHAHILDSLARRMNRTPDEFADKELAKVDFDLELGIIDDALTKAGLTRTEFVNTLALFTDGQLTIGDITKKSVSEAAKVLATRSRQANALNRFLTDNIDDDVLSQILSKHKDANVSTYEKRTGAFRSIARSLDKAAIATLTAALSTASRNNTSGLIMTSAQTGADIMDSVIYHTYNGIRNPGSISPSGIKKGLLEIVEDSFATFSYLTQQSKSQAIVESTLDPLSLQYHRLMRSNPDILKGGMAGTSKATDPKTGRRVRDVVEDKLAEYSNFVNTFNIASDAVFRRAYYARSLRRSFKRHATLMKDKGKPLSVTLDGVKKEPADLDEWLMAGKSIDRSLVNEAIDDALHKTFAGDVKFSKEFLSGHTFVKGFSSIPFVTTAVVPFPRFVVHAAKTVFEYSPFNPAAKFGRWLIDREMTVAGAADMRQAVGKGLIGFAAFMWAYENKEKFPELQWNEIRTNATTPALDMRAIYPANVYMAAADLFRAFTGVDDEKRLRTTSEIYGALEGMTSIPFRTGASDAFADAFMSVVYAIKEDTTTHDSVKMQKFSHETGKLFGEIFGRYTTPFRMGRDVAMAFSKKEATYEEYSNSENSGGFWAGVSNGFMDSSLPNEVGGVKIDERRAIQRNILNSAERLRTSPLSKFSGITFTTFQTVLQEEQSRLGLSNRDLQPPTGSNLLDSAIAQHAAPVLEYRLKRLIETSSYLEKTLNQRKTAFKDVVQQVRKETKFAASRTATSTFQEGLVEIEAEYAALDPDAPVEVVAELQERYAEKYWYGFTGPEARAAWTKLSTAEKIEGERALQKKIAEAKKKLLTNKHISGLDRLLLRGDNVATTKLFGYAASLGKQ
jgi:hypothetical protein